MKKSIFTFFLLITLIYNTQAQKKILPRGFAEGEVEMMPEYMAQRHLRSADCVPLPEGARLRSIAEWEELQAIVISWDGFDSILTEIVRNAKKECDVIIVCEDQSIIQYILEQAGIDYSSNVIFVEDDFNSIWVRDYGPNTVYHDEIGTLGLVDWIYNRPRYADDKVSNAISEVLNIPLYCTDTAPEDLVHTGGNYMADGLGIGFSSELVIDENDASNQWGFSNHSEEEIDQIMEDYMGITDYPKMTVLPYDAIHHIDMHMKLLDEETLLVGQYPEGVADGPQIEENLDYILSNFKTPYGNDYKVIRMPMPPSANGNYPDSWSADYRTYTNSIIINKTILVPVYETQYDTTALRIWNESMPGYNIVGIDCNDIIPLSGAIHCITKEVGVSDPLWISHEKATVMCIHEPLEVRAQIKHISGISKAELFFQNDFNDNQWTSIDMVQNGNSDEWLIDLPIQEDPGQLRYYIKATAHSGKEINRPMVAPEGYWTVDVSDCSVTSTSDIALDAIDLNLSPNPSSKLTKLFIKHEVDEPISIQLINNHGQVIEHLFEGQLDQPKSNFYIDASKYPAGIYYIELITKNNRVSKKMIIK